MRRFARAPVVGVFLLVTGCGGAEFVAGGDAADGGGHESDGAAADAGLSDATVPTDGNAPPPPQDASTGTDASDASSGPVDGGSGGADSGAGDSGDGAASPFKCTNFTTADVVWCADFDETGTPPWGWPIELQSTAGTIAVDKTNFVSPPNGFASSTQVLGVTSQATFASLGETFTSGLNHIDYAFSAYLETYNAVTGPTVPLARITDGTPGLLFIDLILKKSQLALEQSYTGTDGGIQTQTTTISSSTFAAGTWTRVEILLDRTPSSTGPATITVSVDGTELVVPAAVAPSAPALEVDLGIEDVVPPMTANAFTFDNVLVRAY